MYTLGIPGDNHNENRGIFILCRNGRRLPNYKSDPEHAVLCVPLMQGFLD